MSVADGHAYAHGGGHRQDGDQGDAGMPAAANKPGKETPEINLGAAP